MTWKNKMKIMEERMIQKDNRAKKEIPDYIILINKLRKEVKRKKNLDL